MIYHLNDLLSKMGAPEVREKGQIEWHYFDKKKNTLAGHANIRLSPCGQTLLAELKHVRENYEDDNGKLHAEYTETFFLTAERAPGNGSQYKIVKIAFDGEEYLQPSKAVIELGLSIFHARALDISILMIEQTFNKQDILEPAAEPTRARALPKLRKAPVFFGQAEAAAAIKPETFGVVIPFRPRTQRGLAANAL